MYFLDTNTCIFFLNGKYESIKTKILTTSPNEIIIPSVVKAELLFGAYKSKKPKETIETVEKFLEPFEIVSFDDMATHTYAELRNNMEQSGELIGPNDLIIASIVKFHEGILVTNNVKEFKRIKGLKIEDWVKEDFS
jgi:tRNA(fMet)-specific endonuclease VapC